MLIAAEFGKVVVMNIITIVTVFINEYDCTAVVIAENFFRKPV
jgi:hypothetical protein